MRPVKLLKAPQRYEDIIGYETGRLGWLQKLRLVLFFAKHPDEFERHDDDRGARLHKLVGRDFLISCRIPGEKIKLMRDEKRSLRKETRETRKQIRAERRKQRELLAQIDDRKRTLGRSG
jgi:hypothetical protein